MTRRTCLTCYITVIVTGLIRTWVQRAAGVVCLELCHVCVGLAAAVGLAAVQLKLAEPGEHDVLDVLDAGVALCDLLLQNYSSAGMQVIIMLCACMH